jgi:hypothetical protein|tara:strand:+ start:1675 stop:1905 length:231 start_codon:yes stop_codon:yes gene_type:complete
MSELDIVKKDITNGVFEYKMNEFIKRKFKSMFNTFVCENDLEDCDMELLKVMFNSKLFDEINSKNKPNPIGFKICR